MAETEPTYVRLARGYPSAPLRPRVKIMKPRSMQTNAPTNSTPPPKYARALRAATRTALRMAAWNALLIISGLLLIALIGEAYFRLTKPFINSSAPFQFVDGVGLIREPNAELRFVDWYDDLYVSSRTNSLGFLDRQPVSPERAADGCHIAFIGDSFVEAKQTPIADKFHVRLEEMAARELPHLAITAQAYGITGAGQINQLPFYDEYARHLNPNLVTLVFFTNDFVNNSPVLQALDYGADIDKMPFMSAQKNAHGKPELRPPDPEYERFLLPRLPKTWYENARDQAIQVSYFAAWLNTKNIWNDSGKATRQTAAWAAMLAQRPCCAALLDDWRPNHKYRLAFGAPFKKEHLTPVFQEALEYTAFGIDQFKRRADRDGANLAILAATSHMGTRGDPQFDRLYAIAQPLNIPLISDYEYILKQGYDAQDGTWTFDGHWNATGHQWAAEAVLEWLKQNQHVCD